MIWCGSGSTTDVCTAKHRIEKVREANAVRLGDEPEERAVAVEAPRPALLDHLNPRLVVAIEQLVCHLALGRLVGEFQGGGAIPLNIDDGHQAIWQDAPNGGVGFQVFEMSHLTHPRDEASPLG